MVAHAAMHIHSDWSHDGRWPLSKLASAFGKAGYRFIFTTEHDVSFDGCKWESYRQACAEARNERVIIVPGIEYSDPTNAVHVLVWSDGPFLGAGLKTADLLEKVRALNGMAVLAHPSRRNAYRIFDLSLASFLLGVEQWNRKVDGVAPGREATEILNRVPELAPFVGLDFHAANQFFPLSMALEVDGGFSVQGALGALKNRRFSAQAFGISIKKFTAGCCGKAADRAERFRRSLRDLVKKSVKSDGDVNL
jgi:hypothetical protein